MKSLGDLLSRYKNIVPTDSLKKEAAIEVIDKMFDLKLEKKYVSVSNNIIYLKCSTKLKSEVFIHKTEILKKLSEILGKNPPRDIK